MEHIDIIGAGKEYYNYSGEKISIGFLDSNKQVRTITMDAIRMLVKDYTKTTPCEITSEDVICREDPKNQSIKDRANEVYEHLKQIKQERESSKITELEHRLDEHTAFNTAHHLDFLALKKRVKSLEEQHREILPDPEKFICIDLGYPFKKIYIAKPENG